MVTRGRVYVLAAVVIGLACGMLVLIWHSGGPEVGPSEVPRGVGTSGPKGSARTASGPRNSGLRNTGPKGSAPGVASAPTAPRGVRGAAEAGGPVIDGGMPPTVAPSVEAVRTGVSWSQATLLDCRGVPLPHVVVSLRTTSHPRQVLTARGARTDPAGRFRFRLPGKSDVLHLWCPRFAASARKPWRSDEGPGPLAFRLDRAAVIGRLVDPAGGPPRWPGFHLRLSLLPHGAASDGSAGAPVSYLPRTGAFAALLDGEWDVDLEVVATADTGRRELARVTRVNRIALPLTVTVTSPEAHFGAIAVGIASVKPPYASPNLAPTLDAFSGGQSYRLPLPGGEGEHHRTGPLVPGVYRVRVATLAGVSPWRVAHVIAGRTTHLGWIVPQPRGRLRVRPLGPDGAVLRGVRVTLLDEAGREVPETFEEDVRGLLATGVSPGRYLVLAERPRESVARDPGAAPPRHRLPQTRVEVRPGGVHEAVIRFP